jgi:predicted homoserine dehydrogenase-like protein
MIYHHIFKQYGKKETVRAAVIGAGHYGTAIVTQQNYVKQLSVPLVADKDREAAKNSLEKAGIPPEKIVYAREPGEGQAAIAEGKFVYTDNAALASEIPCIDVTVEATGNPEAGARFCLNALEKGKHIAAVSKETDSCVGPILRRLALDKGLVYSPVDGDQPGLLMQLVEWARLIGLTVISGGKSRDAEFILDEEKRIVSVQADGITIHQDQSAEIPESSMRYFKMIPDSPGAAEEYLAKRLEVLKDMPLAGDFDLCELTMMANAVDLHPSTPETTRGVLRIRELPIAYCSRKNNGVYQDEGVIDLMTNLRRSEEGGMGGGVFIVVRCDNAYSNYILTTKGQIPNYDLSTAVLYRPYHLCGVETSTTILTAGLLNLDTGAQDYVPRFDLIKRAACDIEAGAVMGNDHDHRLKAEIVPATKKAAGAAVPGHMVTGSKTKSLIRKGEIITYASIEEPRDSALWELRARQEKMFG